MSQNSYLREFCAQVSQIVLLTELTFFLVYYNCMREKVTKLISSRVLCTKVTNPGLGCFDHFTAYYNCMSKIVTKLLSPRVLFTNVTNRYLS